MVLTNSVKLLSSVTSGTSAPVVCGSVSRYLAAYVVWEGAVTGGQVVIEAAHDPNWTGQWAQIGVSNGGPSKVDLVSYHGPVHAVRARVSATVLGGTVTVWLYTSD